MIPDDQAYQWVQRLRFEAVQTFAFHDPEEALNLFRATRIPIGPEAVREEQETERQFEMSVSSADCHAKSKTRLRTGGRES